MRLNRTVFALGSSATLVAGMLAEQACTEGNYCTGSGAQQVCYLYSEVASVDAGAPSKVEGGTKKDTGTVVRPPDAGDAGFDANIPFGPGDGGPCTGPVGGFPPPECDPSDEMGCGMSIPAGCAISSVCGNPNTCEPFTTNPSPATGIDNFRMRLINLTAPASLANGIIQGTVVTAAVDLPADGGACGENGTGLFNWIISVDEAKKTVTTGGAPPSTDPFNLGYCFVNATVSGTKVAPATVAATFTGNTFSTTVMAGTLNIPIFIAGGGAVILPINGASLNSVTISDDGDCIGSVNNDDISPSAAGPCTEAPQIQSGAGSCSRWHTAGSLGGYITLAQADKVPVVSLSGMPSLCTLLTGMANSATPPTCTPAGLMDGDFCSTTMKPGGCNDSVWLSAQFAASAVKLLAGTGVALCNGGS